MIERMQLAFTVEGVTAAVELLWASAPKTCESIVGALPTSGTTHHAIYSGSECVLLLDQVIRLPAENATSEVTRGDVGFAWMAAGSHYGVTEDFAEVCWFYDVDAEPRMWEGPVPVNLFGRIIAPADDFYAVCRRMRRDGAKPFRIEPVELCT